MNTLLTVYLEKLKKHGEVFIACEDWTPDFESSFRQLLKSEGFGEIRIYHTALQPHHKLICRVFHTPSVEVLQDYPERTTWLKWLPILVIAMFYFLLISLLALDHEKMVTIAFLIFLPMSLGAIVEYIVTLNYPQSRNQLWIRQIWMILGILIVGAVLLREGVICLIMAAPLFLLCTTVGAISMRWFCKRLWKPQNKVFSISLIPLLSLLLLPDLSQYYQGVTEKEIIVNAPIQTVFESINNIQEIKDSEIKYSPIFSIGFPKPISGMTEQTEKGLIRQIYWQRGIHFQEKITQSEAPNKLAWTYIFTPQSFPKGSLDDHLVIGGDYFNLLTTDYSLQSISPNQTKLILRIDYRLSTEVNWYADIWTRYVLSEFSDVVLNIYKNRLENVDV